MPFFHRTPEPAPDSLVFTLDNASLVYEGGNIGLLPTTLTIREKRVGVIGLNGSGKSTLLGLLSGSLTATGGSVRVAAADTAEGAKSMLDPSKKRDRKRLGSWVALMTREDLSKAFVQDSGLVESLGFKPSTIFADEPTKGLDERDAPKLARAVFSYDTQVVFATHDTTLLTSPDYEIDRVLILDEQHVAFDGSAKDAIAAYDGLVRDKLHGTKRS